MLMFVRPCPKDPVILKHIAPKTRAAEVSKYLRPSLNRCRRRRRLRSNLQDISVNTLSEVIETQILTRFSVVHILFDLDSAAQTFHPPNTNSSSFHIVKTAITDDTISTTAVLRLLHWYTRGPPSLSLVLIVATSRIV